MKTVDTLVIGAGQAGLAAGYFLQRYQLDFHLIDANPKIGGSWQNYWDSLRLFSPARYSQLPGLDFPGDPGAYPARDDVITYLQEYARHFNLPVALDEAVVQIDKRDGIFYTLTADGNCYASRTVISATGAFNTPYIPHIAGDDHYQGRTLHTYQYREPSSFHGERVVVVGANNSAVQIGVELAQVADVTLAVRRSIEWWPQTFLGKNLFFWIHATGFDMIPIGLFFHLSDSNMVIDDGTYRRAIQRGRPNTRQMFQSFTEDGVIWADGLHEAVDTVVFATGFRPDNRPYLESLNALCPEDQTPLQRGGVSKTVDGLYFVGVFGQRSAASATLRGVGADARYVVEHLVKYLR